MNVFWMCGCVGGVGLSVGVGVGTMAIVICNSKLAPFDLVDTVGRWNGGRDREGSCDVGGSGVIRTCIIFYFFNQIKVRERGKLNT